MRIQHNIMAMNAYRNYNTNTSALSKNLEKLSSGYKINRAGDDAAGLAISEKMRAQITGLNAAQKNVKDGISLVKTAEGAMQEIQDMLNRMSYLATQSANGTYDDDVDRANLQKEVNQLKSEINRIADSANFNGIKLLDGSLTNGNIVATYTDASSKAVIGMMLPDKPEGGAGPDDVGTYTILETGSGTSPAPSFNVSFNGTKVNLEDDQDAATGITLTIDSQEITLTQADLANSSGKATGETVTSAEIAQAVFDKLTADSAGQFTDNSGKLWNVSVDGENLTFTYDTSITTGNGPITESTNKHFNVKLDSDINEATEAATKGSQAFGTYTVGVAGADGDGATTPNAPLAVADVAASITATVGGTNVTFSATGISGTSTRAEMATALNGATAQIDGKTVTLSDYFNVSIDNTTGVLTIKNKDAGATDDKVSAVNLTGGTVATPTENTNADTGTAAELDTTTGADAEWTKGTDEFKTGLNGYVNYGTEVVITANPAVPDQLASTTLDLTGKLTDGAKIMLGDTTYTIALGADSAFKDAENVVYMDKADASEADIASKLSEVAKDNSIFTVSHQATTAKIGLKQKAEAKEDTDMETIENFAKYIGVSTVDEDSPAAVAGKAMTLQIGDTSDSYNQLKVEVGDMHTKALGIADLDISNPESASGAIQTIRDAINKVSSVRGDLGATQNRLEHTANNLSVMAENIQDAESTIRDTDVAEEMMAYTKNNILIQSAQAMLAQANAVPQGVLQLLG